MPPTDRSSSFPRAAVIVLPLLAALGGCVAAPLLSLATMPAPQTTACANNTPSGTTSGCNTGGFSSMIPGMASVMQVFAPATTSPVH
jgi:hypothetical protein